MTAAEFNKKHGSFFKKIKTGNKFNARRILIDNKNFHSTSEGDYYCQLKLQERAGLIKGFDTQVKESFYMNGELICNYYVDFLVYHNDGRREFIEHKGKATEEWRMKWKMLLAKYKNDPEVICSINWYKTPYKFK